MKRALPGLFLALLACAGPTPTAHAPAPQAHEPAAPQEPWQALGVFWTSLQTLPSPGAPTDGLATPTQALGCLAAGRLPSAQGLVASDHDPDAAAVQALALLLAGDAAGTQAALAAAQALPPSPLLRAVQGHALLAVAEHAQAALVFQPLLALTEPQLPAGALLGPTEGGGPCGLGIPAAPFAWWLARLGLGWASANQGDHLLALEHHQAILARQPSERLATVSAGLALMQLSRLEEASQRVGELAAAWPDDPLVQATVEVLRAHREQGAHAAEAYTRDLARGGEPATCPYEGLGLIYLSQGRTQQAREQLERSIALNPELGFEKYNAMARILMDQGELDQARAMLDQALANHPGDPEALEIMAMLERLEAEAAVP